MIDLSSIETYAAWLHHRTDWRTSNSGCAHIRMVQLLAVLVTIGVTAYILVDMFVMRGENHLINLMLLAGVANAQLVNAIGASLT